MADLALKKQVALNRLHNMVEERWQREDGGRLAKRPAILDERLSSDDWKVVAAIHRLLKPFKLTTLQLQGDGRKGFRPISGGFDDYFPAFEHLLDHLEEAKKGIIYEEDDRGNTLEVDLFADLEPDTVKILKTYINLGWKKLDKYYNKLTSASYIGAVIFNPYRKWEFLDQIWDLLGKETHHEYKAFYTEKINAIWQEQYQHHQLPFETQRQPPQRQHFMHRRLALRRTGSREPQEALQSHAADELQDYLSAPLVESLVYENDPVGWWRDYGNKQYPRLSYMAVDFLTIPSSVAFTERSFNSAGAMINHRPRLLRESIAMAQCIKSWSHAGIYTSQLPIHLLDNEDLWRDVVQGIHFE